MKKTPQHSLGFQREKKNPITDVYEIKAELRRPRAGLLLEYVLGSTVSN